MNADFDFSSVTIEGTITRILLDQWQDACFLFHFGTSKQTFRLLSTGE
jgi:hypothetical protein